MIIVPGIYVRYIADAISSDSYYFNIGSVYKVTEVLYDFKINVADNKPFLYSYQYEILHFNNAINKLLYPDYTEEDEYLVPKK